MSRGQSEIAYWQRRRAGVWRVDFEPSPGGETRRTRPAVIVSNDASNRNLNRPQAVPTTSNALRPCPCEAAIDLNGEPRKAMAGQIATVSKRRLKSKLGTLSRDDMQAVKRAIRLQLGLSGT
jgi:mRNA interferase MazF